MPHRIITCAVLILAALLVRPAWAQQDVPHRRDTRRVHHIVAGDLSTARIARAVEVRTRQAAEVRVDTFVLQLTGDRWRADVVRDVAAAIRASGVRTVVWLADPRDHSVGAGQAALGLIADECWIHPGTRIERRADTDDAHLAPKGTNHARIIEELMLWCAPNARDRGTDPLFLRALLGPAEPMWATSDPGAPSTRLIPIEPDPVLFAIVIPLRPNDAPATLQARFDAELTVGLRVANAQAAALPEIFTPRGITPQSGGALPVEGDLTRILGKAAESLEALDRDIERIERELAAKPRDKRVNTQDFYKELGTTALKNSAKARERLEACEELLTEDPEIARTPPPGISPVGVTPDSCAARWRQEFQKRRSSIARLEKKARGFTGP